MPHSPRSGDFADSPDCSEPADLSSLDTARDRAAELIAEAVRADPILLNSEKRTFETVAIRILATPVGAAMQSAESADLSDLRIAFVQAMMAEVHAFRDSYLAFRCLPIVFNLPVGNETEQDLADEFGFKRATVSNLCVDLRRKLNVPPGRGMRKEAICQKYAARQTGVRARPKASPWPFRGMVARVKLSLVS